MAQPEKVIRSRGIRLPKEKILLPDSRRESTQNQNENFFKVKWWHEIKRGCRAYYDEFQIEEDGKLYLDANDKNSLLKQESSYQKQANEIRHHIRKLSKDCFDEVYASIQPGAMHFYKGNFDDGLNVFTTFDENHKPVKTLTGDEITKFLFNLKLNYFNLKFSKKTEGIFTSNIRSGSKLVFIVEYHFKENYGTILIHDPSFAIWQPFLTNGYQEMVKNVKTRLDEQLFLKGLFKIRFERSHPIRIFLIHLQDKPITYMQRWIFLTYVASRRYKGIPGKDLFITSPGQEIWSFERYGGYQNIFTIKGDNYPLHYKNDRVQCFVWVANWAQSAFSQADFIELDASFYAIAPYVYSIPTAIIKNESIPLGFVLGPSESSVLFEVFYESLKEYANIEPSDKPVLSDEGTAIQKICQYYGIKHYLCYRHLIEKFGAKSRISELVKKLLFSGTEKNFFSTLNSDNMADVFSKSSIKQQDAFCKLFGVCFDGKKFSKPSFSFQSLWERAENHISTTSNHVESYHSKLNESKRSNPRLKLIKYVENIFQYIIYRYDAFHEGRNFYHMGDSTMDCAKLDDFTKGLYHIDDERLESLIATGFKDPKLPEIKKSNETRFRVSETISEWFFKEINEYPKIKFNASEKKYISEFGLPTISENLFNQLVFDQTKIPDGYKEKLPRYFAYYCLRSFQSYVYDIEQLEDFKMLMYGSLKCAPKSFKDTAKLILDRLKNPKKIDNISKCKIVKPEPIGMCPDCGYKITSVKDLLPYNE